jgi:hypothetical protein
MSRPKIDIRAYKKQADFFKTLRVGLRSRRDRVRLGRSPRAVATYTSVRSALRAYPYSAQDSSRKALIGAHGAGRRARSINRAPRSIDRLGTDPSQRLK